MHVGPMTSAWRDESKPATNRPFRELVERHQPRVIQVIHGILHNHGDGEEIAQEH